MSHEEVNTGVAGAAKILWRRVRSEVEPERHDMRRELFPDVLVAEVPGGCLVAVGGKSRSLAFVPGATYKLLSRAAL